MFRPSNYTAMLLDAAKTVSLINAERDVYQCEGYAVQLSEDFLPRCECNDFKADCECIHLDAVGYVLDMGLLPAA